MGEIGWGDFERMEIRVGTVLEVEEFPEARNPATSCASISASRNHPFCRSASAYTARFGSPVSSVTLCTASLSDNSPEAR
jgi:hypothetical protein